MNHKYLLVALATVGLVGPLAIRGADLGMAADNNAQPASAYEVEGKIELRLHNQNDEVWKDCKGDFKIFVNGCGWLIQTTETNDFGTPLRREIGTTNGTELFEMVVPYEPLDSPPGASTNAWGPPRVGEIAPGGFAYANPIPVGSLDSSFVGHLWLMYASGCYFRTASPGQLTPVFDYWASPMLGASQTRKSDWELLHGLPAKVNYYEQGNEPSAVYSVIRWTNTGAVAVPATACFEQPIRRYKEVEMEVTTVRSGCSRSNLLPTLKGKVTMMDFRWQSHAPEAGQVLYNTDHWPSVEEARQIFAKSHPPKQPEAVVVRPEVNLPERDLQKLRAAGQGPFMPFRDAMVDAGPAGGLPKPRSWTLTVDDLKWPLVLCENLADHARVARERRQTNYTFLWGHLTAETQAAVQAKWTEMSSPGSGGHLYRAGPELDALIQNLNKVIKGDSIYDVNMFSQTRLSGDTLKLLAEKPTGAALAQLNRLLLEDEFPMDFVRTPKVIADPASNLRALVVFRKNGELPETLADVSLIGEDGATLWTATINPRIIEPNSSFMGRMSGREGIFDVQFEDRDILVRFNGKESVELELKTGNMQVMAHS